MWSPDHTLKNGMIVYKYSSTKKTHEKIIILISVSHIINFL